MSNKYELGVIVRADLEESVFQADMERIKGLISRFGGTIEKLDDWGRRRMAYPIEKLTEGMYTFITFTSEGPAPKEIESRLRLMESVLRFMIVRKDEVQAPVAKETEKETESKPEVSETPETPEVVEAPVSEEGASE